MKRRYVHIYQCKPGYILADDVYDEKGILIVSKYTMIDDYIIKRLKDFRIRQLYIYEDEEVDYNEAKKAYIAHLKRDYKKNVNIMKQLINDLAAGKKAGLRKSQIYIRFSLFQNK